MKIEHSAPQFVDLKDRSTDFGKLLSVAEARRQQWQQERPYQMEATVKLDTQWPVLGTAIGDVHFGSVYCDMGMFLDHVDSIRRQPNAYIVFMSNLIDNAMPGQFPDSMLANGLNPQEQAHAFNDLVKTLDREHKVLGAIRSGCHEGWTWKHTGQDVNELLFQGTEFPLLDNGGLLHIQLPDAEYTMALYHQMGPFNSNFNKNHGLQQMNRLVQMGKPDILIGAHNHVAESMQTFYGTGTQRKDVVYLRSGCYKGNVAGVRGNSPDMWAQDKFAKDGEPGGESVMMRADRKEMLPFLKLETGLEVHRAIMDTQRLQAVGALGRIREILDSKDQPNLVVYERGNRNSGG